MTPVGVSIDLLIHHSRDRLGAFYTVTELLLGSAVFPLTLQNLRSR